MRLLVRAREVPTCSAFLATVGNSQLELDRADFLEIAVEFESGVVALLPVISTVSMFRSKSTQREGGTVDCYTGNNPVGVLAMRYSSNEYCNPKIIDL